MKIARLTFGWIGSVALAMSAWAPLASAQPPGCNGDRDCVSPLVCREGANTCSSVGMMIDGGTYTSDPVCQTEPPTCTWVLTACQTDSECTLPGWACMPLTGVQPATSICFPKGIVCSAGCPAGWSCVDFAKVAESDLMEMWPPAGTTQFCWPDSLRGVADKTTRVDSLDARGGGTAVGGGSEVTLRGNSLDGGTPGGIPEQGAKDTTEATSGSSKSSGCTLLGQSRTAGPWPFLALVLAWRFGRRRKRA